MSAARAALWRQRRALGPGVVLIMAYEACEALVPVVIGAAVDEAIGPSDGGALALWLGVLIGVFTVLANGYRYAARFIQRAELDAERELCVAVAQRVLHPAGGAGAAGRPGELVSLATSDARRAGLLADAIAHAAAASTAFLVTGVVLLSVSVKLGLLVLLGAPPLVAAVSLLGRPLSRRSSVEQAAAARAAGVATDLVGGLRVLKGLGAEASGVERYRRTSREALAATLRSADVEALYHGATIALTGLFMALVALVGGRLAAEGEISIGDLIASVGIALYLVGPLSDVASIGSKFARGFASAHRIEALLTAPPEVAPPAAPAAAPRDDAPAVAVRELAAGPLQGLSLDVAAGEHVGVVAVEPAEASALLDVLARATDPEAGSVEVGGVALDALAIEDARATVLVADHHADVFSGRVGDDVGAGLPAPRVSAALGAAAADEVVATLPDGLDTTIAARGSTLSGGQRQRIALARALAADAPVLVLHDPTTAVDAVTEALIADGVRRLRAGRTTLLLTTSPALLAAADRVVLVRDGRATAQGSHAELAAADEHYRAAVLA